MPSFRKLIIALVSFANLTYAFLAPRQDFVPNETYFDWYTTPNGLSFDVRPYTGNGISVGTITGVPKDNLTHCLDSCSELNNNEGPCSAVVYAFGGDKMCWMVNQTLNASTSLHNDNNAHTAWASDLSKFENLDTSCPYGNLTSQTTPNGLSFEVYCDSDANGWDLAPGSAIHGTAIPAYMHADTFEECMDYCATMRPKCFGVSWNPGMYSGWWNCYPKGPSSPYHIAPSQYGHFALVKFDTRFNSSCPRGDFTASDTTFNVTCDVGANGTAISSQYEANFGDCMDACATYSPKDNSGNHCGAISYQNDGADGYENCYLMADAQTNGTRTGWMVGQVLSSSSSNSSSGSNGSTTEDSGGNGSNSKSNKAWIAGAVIGALAGAAILFAAIWWWRRQSRRPSHEQKGLMQQSPAMEELDSRLRYKQGELDSSLTERKELEARKQLVEARELPG